MAYPEKRAGKLTGRWYGEERVKGRRFRKAFETKREAEGYEAYVKATGNEPVTEGAVKRTGRTFREVAEDCKQHGGPGEAVWRDGRDPSVIQRVDYCVGLLGDLDIAVVGTLELDTVVKSLRVKKGRGGKLMSNATINRYLAAASAVITYATERGLRTGRAVVPTQRERGMREEILEEDQERAVLAWLRDHGRTHDALWVSVLVETGMRLGEFEAVASEQIANEWVTLRKEQTKTNKARQVWIRPELARDWRAALASNGVPDAAHLLERFKAACKACGYSAGLVLHSLRHTRATRLLRAGVEQRIVMEMMGWASPNMLKRYVHVNDAMHAAAAKKVTHARGDIAHDAVVVPFEPRLTA